MSSFTFHTRSASLHNSPVWRFNIGQNYNEGLQLTFNYLTYSQLRRCMLVSKCWRKLALEELQTRCSVRISNEEHVKLILRKLKSSSSPTSSPSFKIGNVILYSISLESPRIHQLFLRIYPTLHFLKVESPVEFQEATLFQILNNLPNLTHLSVITTFLYDGKSTHKTAQEHSASLPFLSGRNYGSNGGIINKHAARVEGEVVEVYKNIRHLHLDLGQGVTFQLSKIFQLFPNLYELAIANVIEEPRKNFRLNTFLLSGSSLPSSLHSSNSDFASSPSATQILHYPLRHLTLRQYSNSGFTEKLVQTLMRLNMHLKKLVLIFHPPCSPSLSSSSISSSKTVSSCCPLLKQFIESQGASLQSLKVMQVEDDVSYNNGKEDLVWINSSLSSSSLSPSYKSQSLVNYYWNFNYSSVGSPYISLLPLSLPNLYTLHVQKPLITNLAQVLNHFPQLRELSVQASFGSNWKGMLPSKLEPHDNITRLKIDFIDSESFSRLGRSFPSLQSLQLAFCDESLFKVLGDFIPYFNKGSATSRINKENIFTCGRCHQQRNEIEVVEIEDEQRTENYSQNGSLMKGTGASRSDTTFNGQGDQNGNILHENECVPKPPQRKRNIFKHLTRLRLRPCIHLPFQSFVFLQRDRFFGGTSNNEQASTPEKLTYDEAFENELTSAEDTFSWDNLITLKDQEFLDIPTTSSVDEQEGCSSA